MDTYPDTSRCGRRRLTNAVEGEDNIRTTLALQTTVDRLWLLKEHCRRWKDPLVVVVSVPIDAGIDERYAFDAAVSSWKKNCKQAQLIEYKLSAEQSQPSQFPVNLLRNIALDAVETSYVLTVDVDFIPSMGLDRNIRAALKGRQTVPGDEQEALVVPAFERLLDGACRNKSKSCYERCRSDEDCSLHLKRDSNFIPHTFDDLKGCVDDGKCIVFQEDIKVRGHSTTRTREDWLHKRWYDDEDAGNGDERDEGEVAYRQQRKGHSSEATAMQSRELRSIRCFLSDQVSSTCCLVLF